MSNLKVFDAATVFQFPCYAREFTSRFKCFPPVSIWFQFPCYAREFTTRSAGNARNGRGFNSHATRGNSQEGQIPSKLSFRFQFPCYAREFTSSARASTSTNGFNSHATRGNSQNLWRKRQQQRCFNSHATRGNSHEELTMYNTRKVSIPMIRAGIHLAFIYELDDRSVSIPMIRAGIHGWHLRCPFYQFFKGQLCGSVKFLN